MIVHNVGRVANPPVKPSVGVSRNNGVLALQTAPQSAPGNSYGAIARASGAKAVCHRSRRRNGSLFRPMAGCLGQPRITLFG